MDERIKVVVDHPRGCGFREDVGAIYLVSDGISQMCGKFPVPLAHVCECCGQIIYDVVVDGQPVRRSRSHRKLENLTALLADQPCRSKSCSPFCPMLNWLAGRPALLQWVGEEHYERPVDFLAEAKLLGISRRIRGKSLPNWFEVGKTWVFLAHGKTVPIWDNILWNAANPDSPLKREEMLPAIFYAFVPIRAEVICDGNETPEQIDSYLRQGLIPVLPQRGA